MRIISPQAAALLSPEFCARKIRRSLAWFVSPFTRNSPFLRRACNCAGFNWSQKKQGEQDESPRGRTYLSEWGGRKRSGVAGVHIDRAAGGGRHYCTAHIDSATGAEQCA